PTAPRSPPPPGLPIPRASRSRCRQRSSRPLPSGDAGGAVEDGVAERVAALGRLNLFRHTLPDGLLGCGVTQRLRSDQRASGGESPQRPIARVALGVGLVPRL